MSSTFFGLYIAGSGLRAANAALNTTANNVANSDTDGYSRQIVQQQAAGAIRVFTRYGCAGAGVETLAIERVRDSFYDEKYRDNATKLGEFDRKQYYMAMVERYFKDDGKTGYTSIFNNMNHALDEMIKNPSDASTRAQYISACKTLTDYFNNMAGDMKDIQSDLNDEVRIHVSRINSIAQELATVNKQINVIEMGGKMIANELRDTRDNLIDELSGIINVEVKELPIYDSNNNPTGGSRYIVKIAGGQVLVDADDYKQLNTVARKSYEKVNQTDMDGLYDIYWDDGQEFNLNNAAMGGALKGVLDLRDGNNGEYFHGTVESVDMAKGTVTVRATDLSWTDMASCNISDSGGRITIGNQVYYYKDWTFKSDDNGDGLYTFEIDEMRSDEPVDSRKLGTDVRMGSISTYQGIPYYCEQMNEWIRTFARAVNNLFSSGVTSSGEKAGYLFTAEKTDGTQFTEEELPFNSEDDPTGKSYYHLTAMNFSIVSELLFSPELLGVRQNASSGVEEADCARSVKNLMNDKDAFGFRGGDAMNFLACILSDAALNASNANTFYKSYTSLETTIDNQRTSVFGVDQDEEAVAMVKYQNSYTLASKMISTLTEIYDRLILQTGV